MERLGFGLMRLPLTDAKDMKSIDSAQVEKMVDTFLEGGFTYFDTAYAYHFGLSEVALKRAVTDRHPRESFLLADKMPLWLVHAAGDYQRLFEEQLARCGVRYFDYYLLHNFGPADDEPTERLGGFAFLRNLKATGKARHIGFSYHDKADFLDGFLARHPEMEFVQLQINYIDWENDVVQARKCYEVARKHGKQVIVMEPVKGGALATPPPEVERMFKDCHPHATAASWALRYAASLEGVIMVLSGMSDVAQMQDNLATMRQFASLTSTERGIIGQAVERINAQTAISCTACQYCVAACPQSIPIPEIFALYNDLHRYQNPRLQQGGYRFAVEGQGKASQCISCQSCEGHCPQHIEISGWMPKVAEALEG